MLFSETNIFATILMEEWLSTVFIKFPKNFADDTGAAQSSKVNFLNTAQPRKTKYIEDVDDEDDEKKTLVQRRQWNHAFLTSESNRKLKTKTASKNS